MNNSYQRMFLLCLIAAVVICRNGFSQTIATGSTRTKIASPVHFLEGLNEKKITWSWQLPDSIREVFNGSSVCKWYIEKMVRYNAGGQTLYSFYLNNSSLLDSDHYDCFFRKSRLTVSGNGTIVENGTAD